MIEQYVGKTIDCACGKPHRSNVQTIAIMEGVIEEKLAQYIKTGGYQKLTVVCDKNTYRVAGERVCKVLDENGIAYKLHCFQEDTVLPNEYFIGNLAMGMVLDSDLLLAVGSGTLNDITRYISAVAGKPYCVVGTAPSMDGYIAGGSALVYNNLKLTFETHAPDAAFLDPQILAAAPKDMIASGVGDMLGKINALMDWKLANMITGEWRCEFISGIVETAIEKITDNADGLAAGDAGAIADLVEGLLLSGVCMDFAGNSRPASGCEHHFSHFLEMRYLQEGREAVFHGTKVGIGTIIALKAYQYLAGLNPDFAALRTMPRMPFAQWEQEMPDAFLDATGDVIALEKKAGKNSAENLAKRLDAIEKNWEQIKQMAGNATKPELVWDILKKLDAPVMPQQIGVPREMARQMLLYAKELRDRYTALQLLWDLGELEQFADTILAQYYA